VVGQSVSVGMNQSLYVLQIRTRSCLSIAFCEVCVNEEIPPGELRGPTTRIVVVQVRFARDVTLELDPVESLNVLELIGLDEA
jgi:hypothetical protein